MASAARIHLVEKGSDPRGYSMIGFGGAGPAFAAKVARILGVSEVIIPPASGAASAFGFPDCPALFDIVRSHLIALSKNLEADKLNAILDEISRGRPRSCAAGVANADILVERLPTCASSASCMKSTCRCWRASSMPAPMPTSARRSKPSSTARYTRVPSEARLEILSFRIRQRGAVPQLTVRQAGIEGGAAEAKKSTRKTYFETAGSMPASTIATRCVRAFWSKVLRSSRNAIHHHHPAGRQGHGRDRQPAHPDRRDRQGRNHCRRKHVAGRGRPPHPVRSDRAGVSVEPPRQRRGGDVVDGVPHRVFADHLRKPGFWLRHFRS